VTTVLVVVPVADDEVAQTGERADKIIASELNVSRGVARTIIDAGDATVEDRHLKPADRVAPGTTITVVLPEEAAPLEPDGSVPFEVVIEDQDFLVIDKPIGVVVHPTSGKSEGTLVHGLLARYPEIRGVGQEGRWGIVHRLDRDTSGLLVVARNQKAHGALAEMMRNREVTRRYLALVVGSFNNTTGTIEAPIGRDPSNPVRMKVERGGRDSRTHYRRLAGWTRPEVTLLSVHLDTGRTHQIRVHFRAIDHPIVGDAAYGRSGTSGDPGRPWLHARQLSFTHPFEDVQINVVSPLPTDLTDSLGALGAPDVGALTDTEGMEL
jgi:23S rRNA pseudouridine1911/1915/1917 synthase